MKWGFCYIIEAMRTYLSLILTAILLSFLTAYFALNLQKEHFATVEEVTLIKNYEKEFQQKTQAIVKLDLSAMYPTRDYFQLIQPILPTFNEGNRFSKRCGKNLGRMTRNYTTKVEKWESFRCRESELLPEMFFEQSPFIHESGQSYAYLAYTSGRMPFLDSMWVKRHLNYFHISELRLLPAEALDGNFKILATIDQSHFEGIIRGDTSFLTEEYYLAKQNQKNAHVYKVFHRLDLDKYFNSKPYYAKSVQNGESCYYLDGGICWQKDSNNLLEMLRPSSIIIFIASVLILILVSLSLYSRIRMQNREDERKRHALRVLTHELRTPIANLLLQIEGLNKQSDSIDSTVLEELLRMEGEVYRLKRLAEKSSTYLHSQNEKELISFEFRDYSSVNQLMSDIVEDYHGKDVRFYPLKDDQEINLDFYWFQICLKNIIENALAHGKVPIEVHLEVESTYLRIDVVDRGERKFKNLEAIFAAEKNHTHSAGLGMGLSIVQRIMKEMKGKLSYKADPTTFSLYLRSKK